MASYLRVASSPKTDLIRVRRGVHGVSELPPKVIVLAKERHGNGLQGMGY